MNKCFLLLVLFFPMICLSQQKEQRVALVIGNSNYKTSPLKNPINDAHDFASSLRGYGFNVIEKINLTTKQVGSTLREFRSQLSPGSVAVVFYAGHGVQINGENYLPTVDSDISGEEDVPTQSLSTHQIMDVLAQSHSSINLVFLDACRDNPYTKNFRSLSRGLNRENAPSGTLISFATRPGSVAQDGDGRNGLYTSVLLKQMQISSEPIEQILKHVVTGVKKASNGHQEPWMEGSIEGDFCFGKCSLPITGNSNIEMDSEKNDEFKFWEEIKNVGTIDAFKSYLKRYPNGTYVNLAQSEINKNSSLVFGSSPPILENTSMSHGNLYGFINTDRLFTKLGKVKSNEELQKMNISIKEFAIKYNFSLILQNAVYTNKNSDVTDIFISYMMGKKIDEHALENFAQIEK